MVTVIVPELLKMAQQLFEDRIEYVEIEESAADADFPKSLSFSAYDGNGGGIDYEEIEHVNICANYKYQ
jgi:hypothetical protein